MVNDVREDLSLLKPVCPACECHTVYFRIRTQEYVCRRCGHTWVKDGVGTKKGAS